MEMLRSTSEPPPLNSKASYADKSAKDLAEMLLQVGSTSSKPPGPKSTSLSGAFRARKQLKRRRMLKQRRVKALTPKRISTPPPPQKKQQVGADPFACNGSGQLPDIPNLQAVESVGAFVRRDRFRWVLGSELASGFSKL